MLVALLGCLYSLWSATQKPPLLFEAVAVLPSPSADLLLFDTVQLFRNTFVVFIKAQPCLG